MKLLSLIKDHVLFLAIIFLSIFYIYSLPHYMQGGDTAELVAAARFLYLPHPPGYPLWVWLEWAWTHIISYGSLFWQASLLNCFYSLITLTIVLVPLKRKPFLLIIAILSLGLSTSFLESTLLPDVFALHALLVAAIGYLYLFKDETSKARQVLIPFLFFTGLTHHHTIIFLSPLVFSVFIEVIHTRKERNNFFIGFLLGLIFLLLMYSSLFLLNPMSYFSWGIIKSPSDIVTHFLRADYGTFSLSPVKHQEISKLDSLKYFFETTGYELGSLLILSIVVSLSQLKSLKNTKFLVWIFTVLFSISFFYMSNFKMEGMGLEIIKRFHVMPAILITMTCVYLLSISSKTSSKEMIILAAITGIAIIPQTLQNAESVSFLKNDSVFEDYSKNLLKMANSNNIKLILTSNDNAYFGLRYIQSTNDLYKSIAVISPSLLFHRWYFEKVQSQIPDFKIFNSEKIWAKKTMDLTEDLIIPNISLHLITTQRMNINEKFQITYLPLGFKLSPGKGIAFAENNLKINSLPKDIENSPQGFSKKLLYSEYSFYHLAKGMNFYQKNNLKEAQDSWIEALRIVPYCAPALKNLCSTDASRTECSVENKEKIKEESKLIF